MYRVEKRDKRIVDFDIDKIKQAIMKAFRDVKCQSHPSIIDLIATQVTSDFSNKIVDDIIKVEDIQDSVENVLMKAGYTSVAKVFCNLIQWISILLI